MPTTMLEVNNLVKRYGDFTAVDHPRLRCMRWDFRLAEAERAGKSTTIRMIMDIIKPDEGTVSVLGAPLTRRGTCRLSAGWSAACIAT